MNSDNFSNNANSVTISYELLCLLRWLVDHDEDKLKKIIAKAFAAGLHKELQKTDHPDEYSMAIMQQSVVDFLSLLESLLADAAQDQVDRNARLQKLLPAIDKIDTSVCDDTTVRFSVEKTTAKVSNHPEKNPTEVLYEELLKRWKPHDKLKLN